MNVVIRAEQPGDAGGIRLVTQVAFKLNEHSQGTEGAIIDALRQAGALTVSLVATIDGEIIGHIAFSPVSINGKLSGWFGLGPVSVRPDLHRQGIGGALIHAGLARLKEQGARGCVLVGDPGYYRRFGFDNDAALNYDGAPAEYFMRLSLDGQPACGNVTFHEGFAADNSSVSI